ncbi:MAG: response regulator transcription factor, partial [Prevotella sp.]|nr:response regulator transcription factor [Prevotella sp.]
MRILVVDDEQDLCEILQYNLETEGYEVDTANSAEEAMQMQITDYSLLLLDIMMGEMSGFQMARRLKENPTTAHIPIIFITALDNEDSTVKGLNIGADDYIAKPISVKELKARVAAVLRRTCGEKNRGEEERE